MQNYLEMAGVAKHLKISKSKVYSLRAKKLLPEPFMVGSSPRWTVDAIDEWVKSGRAAEA